jgi:hypothetical protein
MPWAVVGSGAAAAGLGYALHRRATSTYDDYDRAFASACPAGCLPAEVPDAVDEISGRARRENNIAIASMSAGAAAVTAGAVLLFMNQPRAVAEERPRPGARVDALLGGDAAGLAITLPF